MNRKRISHITSAILELVFMLVFCFVGIMVVLGTVAVLIEFTRSLVDLKEVAPPFELAIVSTALGGFLLPVALSSRLPHLNRHITNAASLFLGAAISFS